MIDQVDQRLKDWVRTVLEAIDVSFEPPSVAKKESGIRLYLVELAHTMQSRKGRRPPLQISLHYLVTAWADKPEDAHRMLGELVFAAMGNSEFEVVLDPIPVAVWTAFGVPPCPSFILRLPLIYERPEPKAPLVREPLIVKFSPIISLNGVVLGPHNRPIMGAQVELPGMKMSSRTDAKGRFHFSAIPKELTTKRLLVKAKGQEFNINIEEMAGNGGPLIINLQEMEV